MASNAMALQQHSCTGLASMAMARSLAKPSSHCFSSSRLTLLFHAVGPSIRCPPQYRKHCGRFKLMASLYTTEGDRSKKPAQSHQHPHLLAAGSVATANFLFWASPALAVTAEQVAVVLTRVQNVYLQIIGAVRAAGDLVGKFLNQLFSIIGVGLSTLTFFFKNIVSVGVQLSAHIVAGVILPTEKFLQSIGMDTRPAMEAFKTISLAVKEASKQIVKALDPVLSSILQTMLAADSLYLLRAAGLIVIIYIMAPIVVSNIACAVRGYNGELSALQALDMVLKREYFLIDVRTEKEKSKSGVPSLPRYAMNSLVFVPIEDLSLKFKGQLRDYRKAEAEVAAIKIFYLRRINKSSKLVILDSFGDVAKSVARCLTQLGLKNSWVVTDGFDGGRGWVQSRLSTSSKSASIAQILSPTRIISEGAKKIFPSSKDIDVAPQSRKLLPGGNDG